MAIPVHLYGCETWTLKKTDWNRIQAAEMKYLRTLKGCNKIDQLINEDIRNQFRIPPLYKQMTEYRDNGKYIYKGWNRLAFHYKPTNTVLLVNET
jgi:hypothetical protein